MVSLKLDEDEKITHKDSFKIYLSPNNNAFIYIYLLDSQNNFHLIFPDNFKTFDKSYKDNINYFIPKRDDEWFSVDEKRGIETFYLLVFNKRLKKLEDTTNKYLKALKRNKKKDIISLKQKVLNEIINIKKENSNFVVLSEKPTPIAGSFKGLKDDIKKLVVEIKTEKFYTKTIKIPH